MKVFFKRCDEVQYCFFCTLRSLLNMPEVLVQLLHIISFALPIMTRGLWFSPFCFQSPSHPKGEAAGHGRNVVFLLVETRLANSLSNQKREQMASYYILKFKLKEI